MCYIIHHYYVIIIIIFAVVVGPLAKGKQEEKKHLAPLQYHRTFARVGPHLWSVNSATLRLGDV